MKGHIPTEQTEGICLCLVISEVPALRNEGLNDADRE